MYSFGTIYEKYILSVRIGYFCKYANNKEVTDNPSKPEVAESHVENKVKSWTGQHENHSPRGSRSLPRGSLSTRIALALQEVQEVRGLLLMRIAHHDALSLRISTSLQVHESSSQQVHKSMSTQVHESTSLRVHEFPSP